MPRRSTTHATSTQPLAGRFSISPPLATLPWITVGLPVSRAWQAVGCEACRQTGYRGRFVLAELLRADHSEIGRAILSRDDASVLEELALQNGMISNRQLALDAVERGLTSPSEVRRVFGFAV